MVIYTIFRIGSGYPISDASQIEIVAAALLLFDLEPAVAISSPTRSSSSSGNGGGFSFWALLVFAFWHFLKGPFVAFSLLHEPSARKEWWKTFGRSVGLSFLFMCILAFLPNSLRNVADWALLVVLVFGLIPIIVVSIRRMHDIGKRGWWILIPLVNFVMCGFFPGKIDGNPYV